MRISDWSSDVCPSDLDTGPALPIPDWSKSLAPGCSFCKLSTRKNTFGALKPREARPSLSDEQEQKEDEREENTRYRCCRAAHRLGGWHGFRSERHRHRLGRLKPRRRDVLHGRRRRHRNRQRAAGGEHHRSEEHTSELQSLMRISYAVFCLKKK